MTNDGLNGSINVKNRARSINYFSFTYGYRYTFFISNNYEISISVYENNDFTTGRYTFYGYYENGHSIINANSKYKYFRILIKNSTNTNFTDSINDIFLYVLKEKIIINTILPPKYIGHIGFYYDSNGNEINNTNLNNKIRSLTDFIPISPLKNYLIELDDYFKKLDYDIAYSQYATNEYGKNAIYWGDTYYKNKISFVSLEEANYIRVLIKNKDNTNLDNEPNPIITVKEVPFIIINNFIQKGFNDNGFDITSTVRVTNNKRIKVKPNTEYCMLAYPNEEIGISISIYDDDVNARTSVTSYAFGTQTYFTTNENQNYIKLLCRKEDDTNLTPNDITEDIIIVDTANRGDYFADQFKTPDTQNLSFINLSNLLHQSHNGSHLFVNTITSINTGLIPSESIHEIDIANRLGYKWIEVHPQITSDGKYVVFHGTNLNLGNEFEDLNGNIAGNVAIGSLTFQEMKNNYVYRSTNNKYKTAVSSLEEFLLECKNKNIIPMVWYRDKESLEIIKSICANNFILYQAPSRSIFSGPIIYWDRGQTNQQIFNMCDNYGPPFMYGAVIGDRTDEELKELIDGVHSRGCLIGYDGCYRNPTYNKKMEDFGADFNSSGWEVNYFDHGNILNIRCDVSFNNEKLSTNGSINNNILLLNNGQYLKSINANSYFLSKMQLIIRYNGSINLTLGDKINNVNFSSNGIKYERFSTFIINNIPNFNIISNSSTEIFDLLFNVSEC